MRIILFSKVDGLGDLGEQVEVKNGYARNFLIPSGKAKMVTEENLRFFAERRQELERAAAALLSKAKDKYTRLHEKHITMQALASNEGRLYGSISAVEVADALQAETGVTVEKKQIHIDEGRLRQLGEHSVVVELHNDWQAEITVTIEAAQQQEGARS